MTASTISNLWCVAGPLRYFHKSWLNDSFNYKSVYRTAPATPDLLKIAETGFVFVLGLTKKGVHFW